MPIVPISPLLQTQLGQIASTLASDGNAPVAGTTTAWMLPVPNGWDGNPFSISLLANPFLRGDLNKDYTVAVSIPQGTLSDRMTAKIQIDYLAAMERAFRARHASPVRNAMHAAARQAGQGGAGNVFSTLPQYLQKLQQLGTPPPPPPVTLQTGS